MLVAPVYSGRQLALGKATGEGLDDALAPPAHAAEVREHERSEAEHMIRYLRILLLSSRSMSAPALRRRASPGSALMCGVTTATSRYCRTIRLSW